MEALKRHWRGLDDPERERFARGCGTSVGHLKNCLNGSKPMGSSLAVAIEKYTGGEFRADDLLPGTPFVRKRIPGVSWPHPKGKPLLDLLPEAA